MKIPYNRVHVRGQILFASRGGRIHSFNLANGAHLSTWKHPDVDKVDRAVKHNSQLAENASTSAPASSEVPEVTTGGEDEPPAKRQRMIDHESSTAAVEDATNTTSTTAHDENALPKHFDGRSKGKKSKTEKKKVSNNGHGSRLPRVPDRPVITHLTSTSGGQHLLAITGHDKIIWVFEHDGNGLLTQLSQRTMPKRPSSVALGPDSQIICGDKFGDVYSLPLLIGDTPAQVSKPLPNRKVPFKPSATTFTVHSKGNRQALLNQIKQAELNSQSQEEQAEKTNGVNFELTLLLGHVSMLTSLVLGESQGRGYIITGDRDEHIRVSRYAPQAHVIEAFCLGHKDFIGDMTIPSTRADVLVSGGGDNELFAWNWKDGNLLSKTSVLSLAQEVFPDIAKVAVSSLHTLLYPSDAGDLTYVLAICENLNAVFSWRLTDDNLLNCPSLIQLPGKPLHIAASSAEGSASVLIVAIDADEETPTKSLHMFSLVLNNGRLAVGVESSVQDDALEVDETPISKEEVRTLLYTLESLRKLSFGGPQGGDAEEDQNVDDDTNVATTTVEMEE